MSRQSQSFWHSAFKGRHFLHALFALLSVIGATLLASYIIDSRATPPIRTQNEQVFAIHTLSVSNKVHTPTIETYGNIIASNNIEFRALVSGEIIEENTQLREGAFLPKGAHLLTIDPFDYEGALIEARANIVEAKAMRSEIEAQVKTEKGNIERAENEVKLAQRDYQRALNLKRTHTLSEKQIDERALILSQRRSALEARRAALLTAQKRLTQQDAALERLEWRLLRAERDLKNTKLTAPFNSIIREENSALGKRVTLNEPLVTLYDPSSLEVRFSLFDRIFLRLSAQENQKLIGQNITLIWEGSRQTGLEPLDPSQNATYFKAEITRLGAAIEGGKGGIDVYAKVLPQENSLSQLKPGAFVNIRFSDVAYPDTMQLPETALYENNVVFSVKDDRLVPHKISVVARFGDQILVRGLENSLLIMTTKLNEAGKGVKVIVLNDKPSKVE